MAVKFNPFALRFDREMPAPSEPSDARMEFMKAVEEMRQGFPQCIRAPRPLDLEHVLAAVAKEACPHFSNAK